MTLKAFILLLADPDVTEQVLEHVRKVPGVLEAYEVMGPFDIVTIAEGQQLDDITKIISTIRHTKGVRSTTTCTTIHRS